MWSLEEQQSTVGEENVELNKISTMSDVEFVDSNFLLEGGRSSLINASGLVTVHDKLSCNQDPVPQNNMWSAWGLETRCVNSRRKTYNWKNINPPISEKKKPFSR